jgi:hypothetical protein
MISVSDNSDSSDKLGLGVHRSIENLLSPPFPQVPPPPPSDNPSAPSMSSTYNQFFLSRASATDANLHWLAPFIASDASAMATITLLLRAPTAVSGLRLFNYAVSFEDTFKVFFFFLLIHLVDFCFVKGLKEFMVFLDDAFFGKFIARKYTGFYEMPLSHFISFQQNDKPFIDNSSNDKNNPSLLSPPLHAARDHISAALPVNMVMQHYEVGSLFSFVDSLISLL